MSYPENFEATVFHQLLILHKFFDKLLSLKSAKQQTEEKIAYQKICEELAADEKLLLQNFLDML